MTQPPVTHPLLTHGTTRAVRFAARPLGEPQLQTGILHLPRTEPPAGGYPVVVYGHMTTGGSSRGAPSTADPSHPEWRRISQGDALCEMLLERGIAVLRPDYEGIGSPGAHPYLIGASLAESMVAMMRERGSLDPRLGDRWVLAGHSEGAVAALHASVAEPPDDSARLLGTAAFTPVTRMDRSIGGARRVGLRVRGITDVVSALIALMLRGAATADPRLAELIAADGLSPRARELWGDLDRFCLNELKHESSWGGIAPAGIGGPGAAEMWARLDASFRENEVAALRPLSAPVRIDAARFDEVAPAPFTARLLTAYRAAGVDLESRWWPTHHSGAMRPRHAPSAAAGWIARRFEPA